MYTYNSENLLLHQNFYFSVTLDSMTGSLSPRLRSVRTMANFGSPANQTASPLQKALLGSSLKRYSNMSQVRIIQRKKLNEVWSKTVNSTIRSLGGDIKTYLAV